MQNLILTIVLLFSSTVAIQAQENNQNLDLKTVTVSVVNALNDNGTVNFALYTKEGFMKQPLFAKGSTIKNGVGTVTFENVPKGSYAIICFHDENRNKRMDFEENGMPKESYGTSNNALSFGPPQFENSKFEVEDKNLTLEIKF
jgi:uncharacterized protein (DUF2141 family)